jgi:hypothetical protein
VCVWRGWGEVVSLSHVYLVNGFGRGDSTGLLIDVSLFRDSRNSMHCAAFSLNGAYYCGGFLRRVSNYTSTLRAIPGSHTSDPPTPESQNLKRGSAPHLDQACHSHTCGKKACSLPYEENRTRRVTVNFIWYRGALMLLHAYFGLRPSAIQYYQRASTHGPVSHNTRGHFACL